MTAQIADPQRHEATGPRFGLWHLLRLRRDPIGHHAKLRQKYGDVMKMRVFGTDLYATYGPDLAEQILLNRERIFANGPAWSYFIGPFFHRGIMLLDFDEHLYHRRILQHAFTADALRRYHAVMAPHIRKGIAAFGDAKRPRLQRMFRDLTLDLALETFVGLELPQSERVRINKAFMRAVRGGTSVIRRAVPGTPWARGLRAARQVLEEFFREHLPAKRHDGGDDLFAQLCVARSEDGATFSDDDIVNHMIFLLMAAHDTSTTTMTSMAYYLAKHPEWQQAAREEARAVGQNPGYDEIIGMDVLDRIMKESMRLCAPVPSLPRMATRETVLAGRRIPAGAFVSVGPFTNHQDGKWWPDPFTFDPDRFAPERREDKVHPLAFHIFGGGVHKCIGMHFAGLQVRAIFADLLRRYEWSVNPDYTWPLDLAALPVVRDGLPVQLNPISADDSGQSG